ncbi:MAG: hypothetical protein HYV60_00440 [Planctomycetia bacterium]|nr:hypothetical protein [Planctomycetia bacterium]
MNFKLSTSERIRFVRDGEDLFVSSIDVAAALQLEAKVVTPHRMLTFCRAGDAGYCIPVQLTSANHRGDNAGVMLDADVVSRALSCRIIVDGDKITLDKIGDLELGTTAPQEESYNAKWPAGRGFGVGETLPDIPLVNLQGDEVRFSQFLGKRYVLYCWASW